MGNFVSRTSHQPTHSQNYVAFWNTFSPILPLSSQESSSSPFLLLLLSSSTFLSQSSPFWLANGQLLLKPPCILLSQSLAPYNSFSLGHCVRHHSGSHLDFLQASAQRLCFQRRLLELLMKTRTPISIFPFHFTVFCVFFVCCVYFPLECKSHERNKIFMLCLLLYPQ